MLNIIIIEGFAISIIIYLQNWHLIHVCWYIQLLDKKGWYLVFDLAYQLLIETSSL